FRSLEDGQNWLALALDQDLDVDAVQWESGQAADYFKGPDALILWVACDHPLARGEERTLRVRYHDVVSQREDDWVRFDPGSYWYPRVVPVLRSTYDLEFEYPESCTLPSVAEPATTELNGNAIRTAWKAATQISQWTSM